MRGHIHGRTGAKLGYWSRIGLARRTLKKAHLLEVENGLERLCCNLHLPGIKNLACKGNSLTELVQSQSNCGVLNMRMCGTCTLVPPESFEACLRDAVDLSERSLIVLMGSLSKGRHLPSTGEE